MTQLNRGHGRPNEGEGSVSLLFLHELQGASVHCAKLNEKCICSQPFKASNCRMKDEVLSDIVHIYGDFDAVEQFKFMSIVVCMVGA